MLRTGDLGQIDADGYVWLAGRLSRFGKVFGVRVNLQDIEDLVRDAGPWPRSRAPTRWSSIVEGITDEAALAVVSRLAERLRMHRTGFEVRAVEQLPHLPSGKIDYRALERGTEA